MPDNIISFRSDNWYRLSRDRQLDETFNIFGITKPIVLENSNDAQTFYFWQYIVVFSDCL